MAHLSDDQVLANLGSVIGSRRKITAELVAYLGEVEARRLELREACSSMYEFCCRKLKLSEGSAHRHIAAARIARSYPIVLDLLREGRIHVTALSMLQTYLTVDNHAELIAESCDRSKAEVEFLIRSRFPKPDVADAVCPMPVQARVGGEGAAMSQSGSPATGQSDAAGPGQAAVSPHEPGPRVAPLSSQRFHIQFSGGTAIRDKLERALDLMSHSNPKRDLATVIERGLDLLLADLEKKRFGKTDKPRRSRGTKHGDFSRQSRREIYERDGEQCTYTSPSGERCQARAFVQLDHDNPRACGGAGTTDNGRLLCRAHNLFEAEKVFGREYIDSRIRLRQRKLNSESRRALDDSAAGVAEADARKSMEAGIRLRQQRLVDESGRMPEQTRVKGDIDPAASINGLNSRPSDADEYPRDAPSRVRADSAEIESKLLSALTNMGFRRRESKKAAAALAWQSDRGSCGDGHFVTLLRQALTMLVP